MSKAQSLIEYLVLLGGIVIMATFITAIVINLPNMMQTASISKTQIALEEFKKYKTLGQLQGGYHFEANLKDDSGHEYDGTVYLASENYSAGKIGSSVTITGYGVKINNQTINGLQDFTFMTWEKNVKWKMISGLNAINEESFSIYTTEDTVVTELSDSGSTISYTYNLTGVNPWDGQWHHVAWTRQGNIGTVYIDCKLADTPQTVTSQPVDGTGTNIQHGQGVIVGSSSTGTYDELYILNRALSQQEIRALAGC